jgi:hypothetical protein
MVRRFSPTEPGGERPHLSVVLPSGWRLVEVAYATPCL